MNLLRRDDYPVQKLRDGFHDLHELCDLAALFGQENGDYSATPPNPKSDADSRRFSQIINESAFISVHLRPKEYVPTLRLGMAEQLQKMYGYCDDLLDNLGDVK